MVAIGVLCPSESTYACPPHREQMMLRPSSAMSAPFVIERTWSSIRRSARRMMNPIRSRSRLTTFHSRTSQGHSAAQPHPRLDGLRPASMSAGRRPGSSADVGIRRNRIGSGDRLVNGENRVVTPMPHLSQHRARLWVLVGGIRLRDITVLPRHGDGRSTGRVNALVLMVKSLVPARTLYWADRSVGWLRVVPPARPPPNPLGG